MASSILACIIRTMPNLAEYIYREFLCDFLCKKTNYLRFEGFQLFHLLLSSTSIEFIERNIYGRCLFYSIFFLTLFFFFFQTGLSIIRRSRSFSSDALSWRVYEMEGWSRRTFRTFPLLSTVTTVAHPPLFSSTVSSDHISTSRCAFLVGPQGFWCLLSGFGGPCLRMLPLTFSGDVALRQDPSLSLVSAFHNATRSEWHVPFSRPSHWALVLSTISWVKLEKCLRITLGFHSDSLRISFWRIMDVIVRAYLKLFATTRYTKLFLLL